MWIHAGPGPVSIDIQVPLYNWQRQSLGDFALPGDVFNVPVRKDILHRVVRWQLAKRQQVGACSALHS